MIGYDATTLQRAVVYNDTPKGANGGIWMSGQAPSADSDGNLYISTGNGDVGTTSNRLDTINRGESFLKLTRNGTNFTTSSWFTPYNFTNLENGDIDLGSAGLLLIPGTNLAVSGGKQGKLYVVNRDNMGGLSNSTNSDTNITQSFFPNATGSHQVHGGPVWWDGPGASYMYVQVSADNLRQYKFDWTNGLFLLPNFAVSPTASASGQPGGILALTANGTNAGSGIVWASHNLAGDANQAVRPGILRAYNAQNITNELWNSEQISARDSVGNFAKFCAPTVANGKVYLATFSNRLNVYGLLPAPSVAIASAPPNVTLSWPTNTFLNYILQAKTNIVSTNWVSATNIVIISNGAFQVTVPATGTATFYRLKR